MLKIAFSVDQLSEAMDKIFAIGFANENRIWRDQNNRMVATKLFTVPLLFRKIVEMMCQYHLGGERRFGKKREK